MGLPYTTAIDTWSLGCILVELLSGQPLFSGKNEHDQLCRISDILGIPPAHLLDTAPPERINRLFVKVRQGEYRIIPSKTFRPKNQRLSDIVGGVLASQQEANPDFAETVTDQNRFIDLVERMLKQDPSERLTPEQALQHAFLKPMKNRSINTDYTCPDLYKNPHSNVNYGGISGQVNTGNIAPSAELSTVAGRRRYVMDV